MLASLRVSSFLFIEIHRRDEKMSHRNDENTLAYDKERTAYLEKFGLKVMRFPNNYIDCYFSAVCEEIEKYALNLNNQDK